MDALKELKKVLEKQIEEITKKNDISPTELERLDKAVDILKDIETICAMKEQGQPEEEEGEYSRRSYPMYMRDDSMQSRAGGGGRSYRSYDMWDRPMDDGGSYRRGGRGSYDGSYGGRGMMPYYYEGRGSYGYSGDSKEEIRMDLRNMMANAKNDKERQTIQQFLDQWRE